MAVGTAKFKRSAATENIQIDSSLSSPKTLVPGSRIILLPVSVVSSTEKSSDD